MDTGSEIKENNRSGQVSVLFFGQLKERLQCASYGYEVDKPMTIDAFKKALVIQNPTWAPWLAERELLAAVNQMMAGPQKQVVAGDEVAFFPPVTGG